jgi:ubiquinol cytochrome c reductase Fe-S subunit
MPDSTRRNFLLATGAGAAAVGVAAALPGSAAGQTAESTALPAGAQPLVAHVADPRSGSLTLLVGEREVTVHDPALVARLTRAASEQEA